MPATRQQTTTLRSISQALGVSTATVSWVLSGQGDAKGISAATQKRVRDFAAETGYRPNMVARGLSLGSTKTIGLLISSLADPFYSSIAKAVVEEAGRLGYSTMISTSQSDGSKEKEMAALLGSRQVDGIIVTPTEQADWVNSYISAGGKIVLVDRPVPGSDAPSVVIDNRESAFRLVSHLIREGHRRIAIFTTAHNLVNMQARHEGYIQALEEAGIEPDERLFCQVPPEASIDQIHAEIDRLISECPDVDGIFFTTHVLVLPTYAHYLKAGLPLDQGKHWACIHTLPDFELLIPKMSIARMPIENMGIRAVDMLLGRCELGNNVLRCQLELKQ